MTTPSLVGKDLPVVVFALIPVENLTEVQAWYAQHSADYVVKEPVLVTVAAKEQVWCYGSSAQFVTRQARLTESIRESFQKAVAGPGGFPPMGPMPRMR